MEGSVAESVLSVDIDGRCWTARLVAAFAAGQEDTKALAVPSFLVRFAGVVQLLNHFVQGRLSGLGVIHGVQLDVRMPSEEAKDLDIALCRSALYYANFIEDY